MPHPPADHASDTPSTVAGVCRFLVAHPAWLLHQWNWKAAILSSAVRGGLFFATNLRAGTGAAVAALLTEFVLRASTAGFYGATTQAFRRAKPAWAATAAVSVLLPSMTHSVELIVHWLRGTEELLLSIGVSAVFTVLSTQFNLFAMRRDVLIVGDGSRSLLGDLGQVPRLVLDFVAQVLGGTSAGTRASVVRLISRL